MKLFEKKIVYLNNKKIKKYHVLGFPLIKRAKKRPERIVTKSHSAASYYELVYNNKLAEYDQIKTQNRNQQVFSELLSADKKKLLSVRICYVSCTGQNGRPLNDASTRYRCYHPAESIQKSVYLSSVVSLSTFVSAPSYDYDIYIFHRPSCAVTNFEIILKRLKQLGKILIADYDDLIFGDEKIALQSSIYLNNVKTKNQTIEIFNKNLNALKMFDFISVSTSFLKTMVNKYHREAKVSVIHNFLPKSIFTLAENTNIIKRSRIQT